MRRPWPLASGSEAERKRESMSRKLQAHLSVLMCVLVFLTGCHPTQPFYFQEDGDLSHYLDCVSTQARDLASAKIIERLDYLRLGPKDACGFAALNGALCAARQRDWQIHRLDLRNSGNICGDRDRVVGYGAWTFSASTPRAI